MSVINPIATVSVPFKRPVEDAHGNKTFINMGTLPSVVSLMPGSAGIAFTPHGNRYVQMGTWFVPRGSDVLPGDEMVYNSHTYMVIGTRRGDQDHPFTGDDFGWVAHAIKGGG